MIDHCCRRESTKNRHCNLPHVVLCGLSNTALYNYVISKIFGALFQSLQDDSGYTFKGAAMKLDLKTGKILWQFTIVPEGFYGTHYTEP